MNPENVLCEKVLTTLRRIIRANDLQSRNLVRHYGLTGPQLILLKELGDAQEHSVGYLAKKANLSNATVTDILDRLEKRELITRMRSKHDRRKVLVKLTQKGFEVIQSVPSLAQERFRHEFEKLQDWEQSLILSSLQRIAAMMESKKIHENSILLDENGSESSPNKKIEIL